MLTFFMLLELIGTVAFAISGAMVAMRKRMDIFGVLFLGCVTAVGGGVLRDLMIGVTPPACFQNSIYLITANLTALVVFLPLVRRPIAHHQKLFDEILFVADSIGLGVFAVSGVEAAMAVDSEFSFLLLIFIGMLTGTGGGVIRDVLAGGTPYIFVKHIYALAAAGGALAYLLLLRVGLAREVSYLLAAGGVFVLRCLASWFRWNLPKATIEE